MASERKSARQPADPLDLRNLIETMPEPVVCALPDGSVEFANGAWRDYTGSSLEQLSGWVWQTTIHNDDVAKFIDELSMALAAGKPLQIEARIRRADGQYHWFLIRKALVVTPARGSESSPRTLIACEDIHERKQAEAKLQEREGLLQAFFENSPNLIFVKDRRAGTSMQISSSREGAYVLLDEPDPDLVLVATGSEVQLALQAAPALARSGIRARVVSMPSWELFAKQPAEYRDSVLPANIPTLAIEAGATLCWYKWVGRTGDIIGLDHFGASAPGEVVMEKLGFTVENVVQRAQQLLHQESVPATAVA
jgi:PAS domain S-box-containing protein